MNTRLSALLLLIPLLISACADEQENLITPNEQNQFVYYTKSNGLIDNTITALYEDDKGKIWIGTPNGISVYDGKTFSNFTVADGLVEGDIISISYNNIGEVWAGTQDGYSVFNGKTWETSYDLGISSLYLDRNKTFWIGTFGLGLIEWKSNGQIKTYNSSVCFLCNYHMKITSDNSGKVWSSTLGGALRFDNGTTTLFGPTQGMSEYLTAVAADSWNNIWFGSLESERLDRIKATQVSKVNFPTGYTSVTGLAHNKNTMYIATDGYGLLYYDEVVMRELPTPKYDLRLLSILADSKGYIWIGTAENGLIRLNPKDNI